MIRTPTSKSSRLVLALAVVATLAAGSVAVARIPETASADEPARRGTQMRTDAGLPPRAVLISDSAISGIRWYNQQGWLTETTWEIYLESCRRLVAPSCRGREGYAPRTTVNELLNIQARRGAAGPLDLLVIAVGYNDSESRFLSDFQSVMQTARSVGFRRIVWLTYRTENSYHLPDRPGVSNYGAMNTVLTTELTSGRWPELALWDFNAISRGQDWFYSDGLHVTPSGAAHVAQWLSGQLLHPLP